MKALVSNPIYRYILARWAKLRAWHWLLLCLGVLGLAFVIGGVPLTNYLPCYPARMPNYEWSTIALAAILSLFVGQAMLTGLLALGAALLGSTFVGNKEDLLLVMPIPPRTIILARHAAVIRVLLFPLIVVTVIRLGLMFTIQPGLLDRLYTITALVPSRSGCPFMWTAPPLAITAGNESFRLLHATLWRLDVLHMKAVWPLWVASHVLQPLLDVALFAAIGIAVSTFVGTKRQPLVWTLVIAIGTGGIAYIIQRLAALGLSTMWLASINMDARTIWLLPWDFGGGIYPPGRVASVWTLGLPVVTPGFMESIQVFEILWPITLGAKCALLGLTLNVAGKRASKQF